MLSNRQKGKFTNTQTIISLLLGLFFILSCQITNLSNEPRKVLFFDDFSSPNGNWKVWFTENISAASPVNGEMVMIVEQPNLDIISTNFVTVPNIRITVTGRKVSGPDNNVLGVVCRYMDEKNYYSFLISSDGYFGIAKTFGGNLSLISSNNMQYANEINQDKKENDILVTCIGNNLSLHVNGKVLVEVSDPDLDFGRNGVLAGSFESSEQVVVAFDDYSVSVP